MNYNKTAAGILEYIGGRENLISAAHCATRLRLVIADNEKADREKLENVDGVKGVFEASGQLQIIIGTGLVNKVYDQFISLADISAASKDEVKEAAAAKQSIFKRAIKTLGDVFVPIIPAIVASGLLMGLLEGLCSVFPQMAESGTYTIIHLFSNAAFVFLPVLIAVSAAKVFGGNQFLGAVIGMIMIHPDLMNAWSVAGAESIPTADAWFGLYDINLVGYQGHVIPVVIAVWFMCKLEKKLHKIVPEIIDLFVTPLVTVLVTGYCTLTIFGPVFSTLENWVLDGVQYLIHIPFGIGAFITGGLYAPTVVAGVHHMYNALEAGLLSSTGLNIWMPIATAANTAQGAAALALALKTKNKKTKSMALPASLSAFLGITEPAIFGVNLRYFKCFIAGCIGGAFGALYASIAHIGASAYGITGVFGFLITTDYTVQYALTMLISISIAFILSWIFYKEEPAAVTVGEPATAAALEPAPAAEPVTAPVPASVSAPAAEPAAAESGDIALCAPLTGGTVPLSEVPDETFACEALGKGFAILPTEGFVKAPFNGTVTMVYETGHAIGLESDHGVELLIHVGINTVELGGKYYKTLVAEGQKITPGTNLIEFDLTAIGEAGYPVITPIIITNSDDFKEITLLKEGNCTAGETVCRIKQ